MLKQTKKETRKKPHKKTYIFLQQGFLWKQSDIRLYKQKYYQYVSIQLMEYQSPLPLPTPSLIQQILQQDLYHSSNKINFWFKFSNQSYEDALKKPTSICLNQLK